MRLGAKFIAILILCLISYPFTAQAESDNRQHTNKNSDSKNDPLEVDEENDSDATKALKDLLKMDPVRSSEDANAESDLFNDLNTALENGSVTDAQESLSKLRASLGELDENSLLAQRLNDLEAYLAGYSEGANTQVALNAQPRTQPPLALPQNNVPFQQTTAQNDLDNAGNLGGITDPQQSPESFVSTSNNNNNNTTGPAPTKNPTKNLPILATRKPSVAPPKPNAPAAKAQPVQQTSGNVIPPRPAQVAATPASPKIKAISDEGDFFASKSKPKTTSPTISKPRTTIAKAKREPAPLKAIKPKAGPSTFTSKPGSAKGLSVASGSPPSSAKSSPVGNAPATAQVSVNKGQASNPPLVLANADKREPTVRGITTISDEDSFFGPKPESKRTTVAERTTSKPEGETTTSTEAPTKDIGRFRRFVVSLREGYKRAIKDPTDVEETIVEEVTPPSSEASISLTSNQSKPETGATSGSSGLLKFMRKMKLRANSSKEPKV